MSVKATNTITLSDVLVGDVWVASGQSNMEFPMRELTNADAEIAAAKYPKIRVFRIEHRPSDFPRSDVEAKDVGRMHAGSGSGVLSRRVLFCAGPSSEAEYPNRSRGDLLGRHSGGILDQSAPLSADASLMPVFAARSRMVDGQETTVLQMQQEERDYQQSVEQAKAEGKPVPWRNWHPDFAAWAPAALFNGMIAPLTHFAIRGVIWYQGESNDAKRAPLYSHLFPTMINDWRRAWDQGDFPFLFVQIANFNTDPEANWPEIRDAQRRTLSLRNTGMAVTIDIGDPGDIHPKDKLDVGSRLALAARAISYGEILEWSGPLYRQLTREDHALRVWFDHAKGLAAKGGAVSGFEVAGADSQFVPADAKIEGTSVVVSSSSVSDPVSVRYGWAANPTCNLFNREGLPASPFQAPE